MGHFTHTHMQRRLSLALRSTFWPKPLPLKQRCRWSAPDRRSPQSAVASTMAKRSIDRDVWPIVRDDIFDSTKMFKDEWVGQN